MSEMSVASINERAADEYFKRGQEALNTGQQEKAVEFFERALNENPDHESACFNLALLYDRRAEDAKAIELYERICTSPPVHLNALINLALLYEDNNHYDEAHRCLDAVLKTNPNHERARMYMKDVESARSMYYDEDDRNEQLAFVRDITLEAKIDRTTGVLDIHLAGWATDFRTHTTPQNGAPHVPTNPMQDLRQDHLGRLRPARQPGQGRRPRPGLVQRPAHAGREGGGRRLRRWLPVEALRPLTPEPVGRAWLDSVRWR